MCAGIAILQTIWDFSKGGEESIVAHVKSKEIETAKNAKGNKILMDVYILRNVLKNNFKKHYGIYIHIYTYM